MEKWFGKLELRESVRVQRPFPFARAGALLIAFAATLACGAAQARSGRAAAPHPTPGAPLQLGAPQAQQTQWGAPDLRRGLNPQGPLAHSDGRKKKSRARTPTSRLAPEPAPRSVTQHGDIDHMPVGAIVGEPAQDAGALAKSYCAAIAAPLADARQKWQAARMRELEAALEKRVQELNGRLEEMRRLLAARDEAAKKAEENVIAIYAKMKPESAAAQLSAMDEMSAAAVLARLNPRNASLILNEIAPAKAARLTNAMTLRRQAAPGEKGAS